MGILNFLFGDNNAALEQRISALEVKEKLDMATINDAITTLVASVAANKTANDNEFAALTSAMTTITNSVNDLKAAINSQPDMSALIAQITPLVASLDAGTAQANQATTNLQTLASTAKAADPGAPTSAPVNS